MTITIDVALMKGTAETVADMIINSGSVKASYALFQAELMEAMVIRVGKVVTEHRAAKKKKPVAKKKPKRVVARKTRKKR
jgi:hypothetical protein